MEANAVQRRLAIFATGIFAIGSIGLAAPASAASCEPTRSLSNATVKVDELPNGGSVTRYSFLAGQGNSSPYEARLTVSKTNLNYTTLTPTNAPFLREKSQTSLASGVSALVHVNGDFFDFSSRMPYSALGVSSQLSYSPQVKSRVIGLRQVAASSKTGIRTKVTASSGSKKFSVIGLNLPAIPSSSIVAYTSSFSAATLPSSAASILVVKGKITRVYTNGTSARPTTGYLFSATGSAATALRKLVVKSSFTYKAPSGKIPSISRDYLTSSGTIANAAGKTLASISAVNFWSSNYSSAVVLFDSQYDSTPPAGAATVSISSAGVIETVLPNGGSIRSSNGSTILQFFGSAKAKVAEFVAGAKVKINRSFKPTSGNSYDTVFGVGGTLVSNGSVVASCTGNSNTVRPRTGIGWDDYGNVYLATTTMGRDWFDGGQGGYRLGGSTVHQIADWLKALGATNGVSLDGGGSTTMLAQLAGSYRRMDLPDGVWVRSIPVGVALIAR